MLHTNALRAYSLAIVRLILICVRRPACLQPPLQDPFDPKVDMERARARTKEKAERRQAKDGDPTAGLGASTEDWQQIHMHGIRESRE